MLRACVLAIVEAFVCLSVRPSLHGTIVSKRCKLGLRNFHRWLLQIILCTYF